MVRKAGYSVQTYFSLPLEMSEVCTLHEKLTAKLAEKYVLTRHFQNCRGAMWLNCTV